MAAGAGKESTGEGAHFNRAAATVGDLSSIINDHTRRTVSSALGEVFVKFPLFFPVLVLLAACSPFQRSSGGSALEDHASRQQNDARQLASQYLDCVKDISKKTKAERLTDNNTRLAVVLESCEDIATRYTVVQEQSYANSCLASGQSEQQCDPVAVRRAAADLGQLQKEARLRLAP